MIRSRPLMMTIKRDDCRNRRHKARSRKANCTVRCGQKATSVTCPPKSPGCGRSAILFCGSPFVCCDLRVPVCFIPRPREASPSHPPGGAGPSAKVLGAPWRREREGGTLDAKAAKKMGRKNGIAKISRPRISGAVPRPRLFTHLDGACERSSVWVEGPPGYGKTTLIVTYLDRRRRPAIWYHVDAGDTARRVI